MKKIITLGIVALMILSMVGCVNTGEIAKGKDIEELENTIEELESTIDEQNKKHYSYDTLQQLYIDLEENMKLDEANELISKHSPEIDTIGAERVANLKADGSSTYILVAFSKYIDLGEGYYDIHKVVNGDYIRFGVKMNDVGQLYIYNIEYTNYAKDVWCEKYELGVCDDGAWVYDYEFNSAEEQINYIIDK